MTVPKRLLTRDAAALLGLSRQRISQLIGDGRLVVVEREATSGKGRLWLSGASVAKLMTMRGREGATR